MSEGTSTRGGYRGNTRGRGRGGYRGRGFPQKRAAPADSYDYGDASGYSKKRKINDDVYRFLVPESLVRAIIGRGGEHIKQIKEEAKEAGIETKVSIYAQGANGVPLSEGAADRVMSVQSSEEGLQMALNALAPTLQREARRGEQKTKAELRLIVPTHCCSGIIGKGGSIVKRIKEETRSYIQVYTLPLPLSEEHCVRIQNFEIHDLVLTAVKIFESISDIKGKAPIIMYDPLYFEHGEHGDTGSYVDTDWYQSAIRAGTVQPTPFKAVRAAAADYNYNCEQGYEEYSASGYEGYGGYEEYGGYQEYGYEEPYVEDPYYAPAPRARAAPRARGAPRSRGGPRGAPRSRGYAPRG